MRIGVIGCGNMGSALIRGVLKRKPRLTDPSRLMVWDPDREKLQRLKRSFGIQAARSNLQVAKAPVILLAVKPQQMEQVLAETRPALSHLPLLISIAAGIPTRWIEGKVGRKIPVIRVMPNTPALVGAGISAVSAGRAAGRRHLDLAKRIFASVGEVVEAPEAWMNGVTAVSGSGPAYFFFLMEQMEKVGVELGLSPKVARRLALATAEGAARLAGVSGEDPGLLRRRVTSKGGTTEAALRVFKRGRLEQVLKRGIRAAAQRAKGLAR